MKTNTLTDNVFEILKERPETRGSDRLLFSETVRRYAKLNGFGLERVDTFFLKDFKKEGIPDYESVGRARRKLQEEFPEIRADISVEAKREEREDKFRQFAFGTAEIPW